MNIIPIAFAFDNNLAFPACVCLSSRMMPAKPDTFYDIFILHSEKEELQKEDLNKLPTYFPNCRITYRTVDETFDQAFQIRGITASTYYRLMIPELIPEYDKIIYSDVDVIFREDLSEIFISTNLDTYYIAGVNSLSHLNDNTKKYYTKIIGIDPEKVIYAGNVIFNSKEILKDEILAKFKQHAFKKYRFQDLDIINIVCKGHIKYLPPSFCVTTDISEYACMRNKDIRNIWNENEIIYALKNGIVHFNGQKPWKGGCINFDIWWEYYRKSPYFNEGFYFEFFNRMLNEHDLLPLWKRIKILIRFFIYGRRQD